MTRGSSIGANDLIRAPHHAPYAKHVRRDFNSVYPPTTKYLVGQREGRLSERSPADRSWAAQAGRFHSVQGDRLSHSFSASMQTGIHTSPGLFATALAGVRGEETPQRSFITQFLIDVLAVLVAFTLIIATGLGLGFAVFALLFLSF